jgi:hypothetical protein
MARIVSKQTFTEYLKRKLGSEFIPAEISVNNWEDIIQDGIDFFSEYISGFQKEEVIKLETSVGVQEYNLDPNIIGVSNILERSYYSDFYHQFPTLQRSAEENEFLYNVNSFAESDMFSYELQAEQNRMFNKIFKTSIEFEFRHMEPSIYFHSNPGDGIYLLNTSKLIDFDATGGGFIWNVSIFKKYCTALAFEQFYRNVAKFDGFNIPGGGTLNMDHLRTEGPDKVKELEEWIYSTYMDPLGLEMA